jgi:hypothetical protein
MNPLRHVIAIGLEGMLRNTRQWSATLGFARDSRQARAICYCIK